MHIRPAGGDGGQLWSTKLSSTGIFGMMLLDSHPADRKRATAVRPFTVVEGPTDPKVWRHLLRPIVEEFRAADPSQGERVCCKRTRPQSTCFKLPCCVVLTRRRHAGYMHADDTRPIRVMTSTLPFGLGGRKASEAQSRLHQQTPIYVWPILAYMQGDSPFRAAVSEACGNSGHHACQDCAGTTTFAAGTNTHRCARQ